MDIDQIEHVAQQAGRNAFERVVFETVDNHGRKLAVSIGEFAATLCDVVSKQGGSAAECAIVLRAYFKATNKQP